MTNNTSKIILRFLSACLAALILTACASEVPTVVPAPSPAPIVQTPAPTPTNKPTAAPATATPTPTETPPVSTALPTKQQVDFRIAQLCPKESASVFELGITQYRFLVRKYFEISQRDRGYLAPAVTGVLVVTDLNRGPEPAFYPELAGWTLTSYRPENDGRKIELFFKNDENEYYERWSSSWDGKQQEKIYEFNSSLSSIEEVSNLAVTYKQYPEQSVFSKPVSVLNLLTKESYSLPALPKSSFNKSYVISGTLYIFYGNEITGDQFVLYNDKTKTATPAFLWFRGKDWVWNLTTPVFQHDNLFSVFTFRPYGFDYALNLSLSDLFQTGDYTEIMSQFHLPNPADRVVGLGSEIYPIDQKIIFQALLDTEPWTSGIYMVDFQNNLIADYCLHLNSGETIAISPDKRFLAITNSWWGHDVVEHSLDYPLEIIFLDIETGNRAILHNPNFEIIGWGPTDLTP